MARSHLTTGDVAEICGVAPRTVATWIDTGRLKGFRLPGTNHRRVEPDAMRRFLVDNKMPEAWLDRHLAGKPARTPSLMAEDYDDYDFSCNDAPAAVREILAYVAQVWPAAACESLDSEAPAILVEAYLKSMVADSAYADVVVYQSHQVAMLAETNCTLPAVEVASIGLKIYENNRLTIGMHSANQSIMDWILRGDHQFCVKQQLS